MSNDTTTFLEELVEDLRAHKQIMDEIRRAAPSHWGRGYASAMEYAIKMAVEARDAELR